MNQVENTKSEIQTEEQIVEDLNSLAQKFINFLKPFIEKRELNSIMLNQEQINNLIAIVSYILPNASLGTCDQCGSNYRYEIRDNKRFVCCSNTPPHCFQL